jgi:hypothetical protein
MFFSKNLPEIGVSGWFIRELSEQPDAAPESRPGLLKDLRSGFPKIIPAQPTILAFWAALTARANLKKKLDWQAFGFVYSNYLLQFCIHYILFKNLTR